MKLNMLVNILWITRYTIRYFFVNSKNGQEYGLFLCFRRYIIQVCDKKTPINDYKRSKIWYDTKYGVKTFIQCGSSRT